MLLFQKVAVAVQHVVCFRFCVVGQDPCKFCSMANDVENGGGNGNALRVREWRQGG